MAWNSLGLIAFSWVRDLARSFLKRFWTDGVMPARDLCRSMLLLVWGAGTEEEKVFAYQLTQAHNSLMYHRADLPWQHGSKYTLRGASCAQAAMPLQRKATSNRSTAFRVLALRTRMRGRVLADGPLNSLGSGGDARKPCIAAEESRDQLILSDE